MEYQSNFNGNQDHKISSWWIIAAVIIAYILGAITGSMRACAQSPASVKGYIGGQYTEARVMVDCDFSEDNRKLDFSINGNTIHFDVWTEKMTILEDSVVRTEYVLDKNSTIIIEPAYKDGKYIGDYCKMIIREIDLYDKLVFLFWQEPDWEEDIAKYQ
jgi:hypothetical protein